VCPRAFSRHNDDALRHGLTYPITASATTGPNFFFIFVLVGPDVWSSFFSSLCSTGTCIN